MLNVDCFNPYKHMPGSIRALYCVFANLPREERYKRDNILLQPLIEGAKTPSQICSEANCG